MWARLRDGRIAGAKAEPIYERIERGELALTEPLVLEMRYSARDHRDFALLAVELDALPRLPLDARAAARALEAQAQLGTSPASPHRVKPVDLLVAAVAERDDVPVLHYDADYDVLATHTDLRFQSVWAVPRGSAE